MNGSKICFSIFISSLLLVMSACGAIPSLGGSAGEVVQSRAQRINDPQVAPVDLKELVASNNTFALDFYQDVRASSGNLFFSPYSLSSALAMTYAGARGITADQMAQVLHFSLPQDRLHPAFNSLDLQLGNEQKNRIGEGASQPFQLDIANQLWGQQDFPFLPPYIDLLQQNYGAGLRLMDFIKSSEPSRKEINDWVSQKTHEKIQDLIPAGGINEFTRLVLTNAIYFKADWTFPFEKNNTHDVPFTLLDGSQVNVPMMSFEDPNTLSYVEGLGVKAVELPYVGDTVSMWILVPDQGAFADFEASLNEQKLEDLLAHNQPVNLQVVLPKFEFTKEYQLSEVLSEMGMPDAFSESKADFSGMSEKYHLWIDQVFHKAFVAVDEKGTEAAAASAVVMRTESMPMQPKILTVDRPFIFLIRHKTSGSILFMGRVLDPRPDSGS